MPIPSGASIGWVIAAAIPIFTLCTILEMRLRKNIRLGRIDESKYSPKRLAEFRRMRERMNKVKDNV